jgi:hypothetical protein
MDSKPSSCEPFSFNKLGLYTLERFLVFFFLYQANDPDSARIIDLNICCIRTAVKLLDRLQLRPLDGSSGDDTGHALSRLFGRYSGILLKGLEMCDSVGRFLPTYDTFGPNLNV